MQTGLLLLVVCCLWVAEGQNGSQRGRSVWEDPVTFTTKGKDACVMHVTGQGDMTTLRVECQGEERSYWCDYRGKPQVCRSYNNNPRHYFTQIMWDLRKLQHACRGPTIFKPQMCKKASDEARMAFIGASPDSEAAAANADRQTRPSRPTQTRPVATRPERPQPHRPTRPQPARPTKPDQAKSDQGRPLIPRPGSRNNNNNQRKSSTSKPSTTPTQTMSKTEARKIAQDYCWRSLTGVCAYVIGLFRN